MRPFDAEWRPSADRLAWAQRSGFTTAQVEAGIVRCRDHFAATGQAYASRSGIWSSWMIANTTPANKKEAQNGHTSADT